MVELTESGTVYVEKASAFSQKAFSHSFCHLQIRKPTSEVTAQLELHDFRFQNYIGILRNSKRCEEIDSRLVITGTEKSPPPPQIAPFLRQTKTPTRLR